MTVVDIKADEAIKELQRVNAAFRPDHLLGLVGDRILAWLDQNFQSAGAEIPWAPLRPNTISGRRGGSSAPLQDTGRLRQSSSRQVLGETVKIGYSNKVAEFHHFGTSPYLIRPRNAQALRFMTVQGVTFSKLVRHPGLPRRRLLPSDALAGKLAADEVDAVVERATGSNGAA